jgi:membrane peptidoglycan carboxypeptidase
VVDRLAATGADAESLATGGFTIRTTLDPRVTEEARRATREAVPPRRDVADVTAVVAPGPDRRPVLALAANRTYGNDSAAGQSALPLATAPLRGAGSVYKIFTAAAALDRGLVSPDTTLDVPDSYTATTFDDAGSPYTVDNLGSYDDELTLEEALAVSPNTPFVALEDRLASVAPVVDAARRLGLRTTLAAAGPDGRTLADRVVDAQRASFTLGPDPTSPLDLASVAATIADDGVWCPPTLLTRVTDRDGRDVTPPTEPCARALSAEVADQLATALSRDHVAGTSADAADDAGWDGDMISKTGTTQRSASAAFIGATDRYAAAVMTFSLTGAEPVCLDPVRTCDDGELTCGSVPARTWYEMMAPLHEDTEEAEEAEEAES